MEETILGFESVSTNGASKYSDQALGGKSLPSWPHVTVNWHIILIMLCRHTEPESKDIPLNIVVLF